MGDRLRLSRARGRPRRARGISDPEHGAHASICIQCPPSQIQSPARPTRSQFCLRLRIDQQANLPRAIRTGLQLLSGHRACVIGTPAREGAAASPKRSRARARGGVHNSISYWNPVGGSDETARGNLLHAMELLKQAGFIVENMRLIDTATGEPMQVEFLIRNPAYKPIILIYKAALERLGIGVTIRLVDPVHYENRLRDWDFDIVVNSWVETLTPGNEQRTYWGSKAAQTPGSRHIVGISNHAVDALIG